MPEKRNSPTGRFVASASETIEVESAVTIKRLLLARNPEIGVVPFAIPDSDRTIPVEIRAQCGDDMRLGAARGRDVEARTAGTLRAQEV